ncbi:aminoglycoside phosphotransferase family protein [Paenarthrobacter sp. Z7-10]|uniref:aminoglycoside phosphotransferase family protein n=1 Tax=Paenarthrobacter sp. Z7-10 TaxID=2787635 RepID=UPI0022A8E560|nr:aminoglycoside phosphotransferase family protein [Paenarthrobacter sp. Z7-10]MCZ2404376.1 aminoglycoside phosphotransferase family protein [Paenarthrobacter sp. Z7-10]
MPAAEIDVDAPLVRSLLLSQHPDLSTLAIRTLSNGWDNALFRLGREYTVRLPRRAAAAQLVRHEQRWLPEFSRLTRVSLPLPVRVGQLSPIYPWYWSVSPWLEGTAVLGLPPGRRNSLALALARFIADIHRPAPADAPRNPVRGTALALRDDAVRARLSAPELAGGGLIDLWQELVAAPLWRGPQVWLHGDLHPGNILHRRGTLTAVIDFGDLTSGDPATDLATAWMTFDARDRSVFRREVTRLCGTDGHTWRWAQGWALNIGSALLTHSDDNPPLRRLGEHTLAQVLSEA